MIYVSSACSTKSNIAKAVQELADNGFRNIELSGGTKYYPGYADDLLELQERYNLEYLLHNYFPPPPADFVVNLASLDDLIYQQSLAHLHKAIELSKLFKLSKFGFHAGFFVDLTTKDLGKKLKQHQTNDCEHSLSRFYAGYKLLQQASDIELYIENNVYSHDNCGTYGATAPFMLLCHNDLLAMQKEIDFKLLLDVAHLFVSCRTLVLDFTSELQALAQTTDYLHISNNDGFHDGNLGLTRHCEIYRNLELLDLDNKIITLEIYQGADAIHTSIDLLNSIIANHKKTRQT